MSLLGKKIGHIRVTGKIGAGGFGQVYSGIDEKLQRRVALKRLHGGRHGLDDKAKQRFLREARILSRLEHPNICQIYDYLEHESGDLLVLERIDGKTLERSVRDGLDDRSRLAIAGRIAAVLAAAHAEGVVHRDLKPANVMLTHEREVKVLDFGLAHIVQLDEETLAVSQARADEARRPPSPGIADGSVLFQTEAGEIAGTPHYMSPEQARGEAATPASDMYSFGLLLQFLFTGEPPYETGLRHARLFMLILAAETLPADGVKKSIRSLIENLKSPSAAARPSAAVATERLRQIRLRPGRLARRAAAAMIASAFLVGGVKYTLDLGTASAELRRQRDRALAAETAERQVADFLVDLFEVSDPNEARGNSITARELLDRGSEKIREELREQPLVRARLLTTIGSVYLRLGLYEQSEPLAEEALELRERLLSGNDRELAESHALLGAIYRRLAKFAEAERLRIRRP